jgi:hypothetical protein
MQLQQPHRDAEFQQGGCSIILEVERMPEGLLRVAFRLMLLIRMSEGLLTMLNIGLEKRLHDRFRKRLHALSSADPVSWHLHLSVRYPLHLC